MAAIPIPTAQEWFEQGQRVPVDVEVSPTETMTVHISVHVLMRVGKAECVFRVDARACACVLRCDRPRINYPLGTPTQQWPIPIRHTTDNPRPQRPHRGRGVDHLFARLPHLLPRLRGPPAVDARPGVPPALQPLAVGPLGVRGFGQGGSLASHVFGARAGRHPAGAVAALRDHPDARRQPRLG